MFQRKTLIVVGAGASMEVDLPSGRELTREIAELLNIAFDHRTQKSGDYGLWKACETHAREADSELEPYFAAARRIHGAMPQAASIDSFIDDHSGDKHIELCGKLAIVRSVLSAESRSKLIVTSDRSDAQLDYINLEPTWFNRFWSLLSCPLDQLAERLASFAMIVFNYDRCIEHFLYYSLQNYYGVSAQQAADILTSLTIYHPYGTVGHLPWQGGSPSVAFGGEVSADQLLALSKEIRTFTEETDPASTEIQQIHRAVLDAQVMVFLGFAFHPNNMTLITPPQQPTVLSSGVISYYVTAHGMSDSNQEQIKRYLRRLKEAVADDNSYNVTPKKCVDFFDEYSKSLEFS